MLRKAIRVNSIISLLIFLILPSFIAAQTQEYQGYKDYTVEKGDTLWDISQKELNDSFLWPKVWKENPQIKNPDGIYPKQKIRIPLYLLQKEVQKTKVEIKPEIKPEIRPEIRPEIMEEKPVEKIIQPIKKEYLVNKRLLIASGYIADSVHSVGRIVGTPSERTLLGKDDYAYIRTDNPVNVGDKFYIVCSLGKVAHPKSGCKLGFLIEILGIAQVVGKENNDTKVIITDSYEEISTGSLLDNFYEIEAPLAIETPRKPDINGYIVAAKQLRIINGTWDIVYIDKGRKDGLEIGDFLFSTLQSEYKIVNGLVQIINLRESTSTAIVRKSNNIVTKGDGIMGVKEE